MGKKITFLMILAVLCATLIVLVSCGGGTTNATWASDATHHWQEGGEKAAHAFGEPTVTTPATCEDEGKQTKTCTVCGYKAEEVIPVTDHSFSTTWSKDANGHWHECACGETKDDADHVFNGATCSVCKYKVDATANLVYEKHPTKDYMIVTGVKDNAKLKGVVVIADRDVSRAAIEEIGAGAFAGQTEITAIIFGGNVVTVGDGAFNGCTGLKSVSMSADVKTIGAHAFNNCTSLTSITISESTTDIGAYAFNGCVSLATVTFECDGLKTIGNRAFSGCTALADITLPEVKQSIGSSIMDGTAYAAKSYDADGVLYNGVYLLDAKTTLAGEYTVKAGTKIIASRAFADCVDLILVDVPTGVKTAADAFDGCVKMASSGTIATVGDYTFLKVGSAYKLLGYTGTSTTLTLPGKVNGVTYTIGDYAFYGNSTITSVTISSDVTAIGKYAFDGCTALTTVTMTTGVASIGECAFNGCTALANLTIGEDVTTIGAKAFAGCAMTTLTIPNSVETIGANAFTACKNITTVNMGSGVETIGENAFYQCNSVENLYVTDLAAWCRAELANRHAHPFAYYNENESNKFYVGNAEVTELVIPAGVTTIGSWVFHNCDRITKVTIGADVDQINAGAFRTYHGGLTTVVISTTGWKKSDRAGKASGTDTSVTAAELSRRGVNDAYDYIFYIYSAT